MITTKGQVINMTGYETKTMKRLFEQYAEENNRICKEEAEMTKKLIVREVYSRIKRSFDMLENATEEEAAQIYKQFIEW